MSIEKYTFASAAAFAEWAETGLAGYFAATDFENNIFTGYRDAGKTEPLFSWTCASTNAIKAYKSASVSCSVGGGSNIAPATALVCKNGVILYGTSGKGHAIITKNNSGATMCVVAGSASGIATACVSFYCATYGDDTALTSAKTFTKRDANQTVFTPFATDAAIGSSSYAPNAFYMPEGPYYSLGLGRFSAGGKTYITNGYWAILDE